jgi:hypothetical protein
LSRNLRVRRSLTDEALELVGSHDVHGRDEERFVRDAPEVHSGPADFLEMKPVAACARFEQPAVNNDHWKCRDGILRQSALRERPVNMAVVLVRQRATVGRYPTDRIEDNVC